MSTDPINFTAWETTIEAPASVADDLFTRILNSAPRFGLIVESFGRTASTGKPSTLSFKVSGPQANIDIFKDKVAVAVQKAVQAAAT
jgi:hypothetical protein